MSEPMNESPNREPGTWHTTEEFKYWSTQQRRSQEIMIYCHLTRTPVVIAWPTSKLGVRVSPEKLLDWLRERNLAWACFCEHDGCEERSCQIGDDIDGGDIGAYCHFTPSRCGFSMNLTRLFRDATYESDYAHLDANRLEHYEDVFDAFKQEHGRFYDSSESEDSECEEEGTSDRVDDEYRDMEFPEGVYFEGFCGRLFPEAPQIQATFATHAFQRLLNDEHQAIRAEKARQLAAMYSRPGPFLRVDEIERAGLTFEDIYCDDLLPGASGEGPFGPRGHLSTTIVNNLPYARLEIDGDIITTTLMNDSFSKDDIVLYAPAPINELVLIGLALKENAFILKTLCGTSEDSASFGVASAVTRAMTAASIVQCVGRLSPLSQGATSLRPVDLDRIYATTQLVDNYRRLQPGAPGRASALEESIQNFMAVRAIVRAHDAITGRQPTPLLASGWLGEQKPGVKQCHLKRLSPSCWVRRWWIRCKRFFSSMEVGIDGV
ncbi:hypothetical protein BKA70DRAFT_1227656 [Coprinopsis sp. MPI-PUGE-AT-0042]|nr:hypothetical protein BKA70DRAFT_1227656 [Coprinopsis sp. MPI-PUGE-AT-0042]